MVECLNRAINIFEDMGNYTSTINTDAAWVMMV